MYAHCTHQMGRILFRKLQGIRITDAFCSCLIINLGKCNTFRIICKHFIDFQTWATFDRRTESNTILVPNHFSCYSFSVPYKHYCTAWLIWWEWTCVNSCLSSEPSIYWGPVTAVISFSHCLASDDHFSPTGLHWNIRGGGITSVLVYTFTLARVQYTHLSHVTTQL